MRRLAIVALFALAACRVDRPDLRLTFDEGGEHVTVAVKSAIAGTAQRDDVVAGRDEWSLRFQHASPEHDSVEFEREKGEVTTVRHSATIAADDLQKFFYDVTATASVIRGDGWMELSIYPGTSDRAPRAQREQYEHDLRTAARLVVRYFGAMRTLYAYLDRHPQRAADVFDQLARDDDDTRLPVATKFELGLIEEARQRITRVHDVDWNALAQSAELVENPLPATIRVRVPTKPLIVEGFEREGDDLLIRPRTLFDAVGELEGRWLSPDPLAMGLRMKSPEEVMQAVATSPRHYDDVVTVDDVIAAVREKLKPLPRYRVRFVTRASSS